MLGLVSVHTQQNQLRFWKAWQFIDRAPNPVLAMDGCYLRKAEDLRGPQAEPFARAQQDGCKNDVAVTIWNNQSKWSECSAQELQKSIFGCKEAAFHTKPSTVHTFLAQYMQMPSNACKCFCITLLKCWIFLISIQQDNNVSFATFDAGLGSWSFQRPEIHQSYPWPWAIWPWGWFPRCFVDACEGEKRHSMIVLSRFQYGSKDQKWFGCYWWFMVLINLHWGGNKRITIEKVICSMNHWHTC